MGKRADRSGGAFGRGVRIAAAAALLVSLPSPPAAGADDAAGIARLRIGLLARPGAGTVLPGVAAIERAFARATGLPVTVFVARDLPALVEAQAGGRIDYAVHSAVSYAVAARLCGCVEPLAAPRSLDGSRGILRILVMRAGAAPRPGGPRIAVPGGGDPIALLRPEALPQDAETVGVAGTGDAERLFAAGEVDGFLGWAPAGSTGEPVPGGSPARLAALGVPPAQWQIAWQSPLVPYGPHAVSKDLPGAVKAALRSFLTALRQDDPDVYELIESERQGGFAPASEADYAALADLVGAIRAAPGRDGPGQ